MRKMIIMAVILAMPVIVQADKRVNGYTRSDGTYVQPYTRSDSNQYKYDNYSSKGNSNPYTGSQGTQSNEYSNPPSYNKSYNKQPCYINCKDD